MTTLMHRCAAGLVLFFALAAASVSAAEVIKSENDPRAYRALVLENQLKVILVSDPDTDLAAASLSVDAGSGADPRDREGLAHFLEHMLFLGTEKYPEPGEYKDFITRNGGGDNAYTAYDETNYFFEVKAGKLEGALDRFAQFFIAPLFNQEYVERERMVVHSEYLGRRGDDRRRTYAAAQAVMNAAHPASTFAVGNRKTLADREGSDVRQELIAFYDRYYSANLMALTVVGREPLDVLEQWVRSRFSQVENRNAEGMDVRVPLYASDRLPARLDVVPKREAYSVSFRFPTPPVREHWRAKPAVHLAHLLGHEGETSLLAELKRRGWAQALSAGPGFDDEHVATMDVNIGLTPQGADHIDEIARLLFAYIDVIRRDGLERWIFEENARLAAIDFRYMEKVSPIGLARRLATLQHEVPQHEVLRAGYAFDEWRPDLIRTLLAAMRPDNVLVTRVAPGLETTETAAWYETPYAIAPIDADTLARWSGTPEGASALAVPTPNPFVPESLEKIAASAAGAPAERDAEEGLRLWHLAETGFGVPRADFYVSVRSPVANDTPRHAVLTQLFVRLVNDNLNAFAYPADLAGLSFDLYTHSRGVSLRISGYDDRQPVLLQRILAALSEPRIDAARFEVIKAEFIRGLENSRRNQPYSRAMGRLRNILTAPSWSVAERLAVLEPITVEQVATHARTLLSRVNVVALAHGNVTAEEADTLGGMVHAALVAPAQVVDVPRARVMQLRRGDRLAHDLSVTHPESAFIGYFQADDKRLETRALAGLSAQVLSSPFFDALRTQKKLGYVVFANAYPILDSAGLVFIVQSPLANASTLQSEVSTFLSDYAGQVAQMTPADLEQHKNALVARVMEEERKLRERSERFWQEIDRGNESFDTREKLVAAIRGITPEQFRDFFQAVLVDRSRRALVVRADGESTPPAPPTPAHEQTVSPPWARAQRGLLPG